MTVYEDILARISDGRIRPGHRIVEERLAEELGVSRTPIREALTSLQADGEVERTRSGWQVCSYSIADIEDAYAVRATLEAMAAHDAARNHGARDHTALTDAVDAMKRAVAARSPEGAERAHLLSRLNSVFHNAVIAAAGNRRLETAVRSVVMRPLVFSAFAWFTAADEKRSAEDHRRIMLAIFERDARRAERLMHEHVLDGRDVVLKHLRADPALTAAGGLGEAWTAFDARFPAA